MLLYLLTIPCKFIQAYVQKYQDRQIYSINVESLRAEIVSTGKYKHVTWRCFLDWLPNTKVH